jgi:hypothetical protein
MSRLGGAIDGVIGVDPHRDTLAAAVTDAVGGLLAQTSVSADATGYRRLLDFARAQVPGRRCWAVEGAGSYGAGLAAFLQAHGERVVEVGRPKRPPRRTGPRATPWTPFGPHAKRWPKTTCWHPVAVATGRRCGCCWPPTTAPVSPRSAPPTSSRPSSWGRPKSRGPSFAGWRPNGRSRAARGSEPGRPARWSTA